MGWCYTEGYEKSLKSGRINPKPQIKVISERPSLIRTDADAAKKTEIAVVGVTNSNHLKKLRD
ncbi:hypothetical protein [Calothrix sp. CCY 0018]|uniref:hypothetical protein n=1 Tax=Calothrix sp. CCY 0018 TaxID=3103864 RepID=UPI0039C63CC6